MFNVVALVPFVGIGLVVWGLVRHGRTALWSGVGLLLLFVVLSLFDRFFA